MRKGFHAISGWLDTACGIMCVVCIASMVAVTGAQIVCRVFFTALYWSEEVTRYLMVWATFLGASCVYKRMGHISVTIVQSLVSPPLRRGMQILCHLLCGAFFIIAATYGLDYMNMQSRQLSAALRIPMSWVYMAIPIGCSIMVFHVADLLLRAISPVSPEGEKR